MSLKEITFPMYYLQNDWNDSFNSHHNDTIWMSRKELSDSKGKLFDLKISNKTITCETDNDCFKITNFSNRCFIIQDEKSKVTHRFLPQIKTFASIQNKAIISLDVASNGIAVSAFNDGTMKVWDTFNGLIKHELKGHYLDVNKCRFFPSNEVILSAGSDMQLKIWSAIDGSCPVTMIGHKGAVHDVAIVDRGRNIVSVGRDGFAKLWSCAKQKCIEDVFDVSTVIDCQSNVSINSCAIQSISGGFDLGKRSEPKNEDAIGTEDKLFLCGTESGHVCGIGLNSKQLLFKVDNDYAVNCVSFVRDYHFVYGTQNGKIYERDIRKPGEVFSQWNFSHSPVISLRFVKRPFYGMLAGRQDGTTNFLYENQKEVVHLTGPDCDSVYEIASDDKFIYTASRDGKVRKYLLNYAFE